MINRKLSYFVCILLVGLFYSCDYKEVYSRYNSFSGSEWKKDEPALFELEGKELVDTYDVYIHVRHNDEYPFQNLWLFVDRINPSGESKRDTLNIELADIYGKWHGKGMSLYNLSTRYSSNIQYPDSGLYKYRITQGMRKDVLEGVSDIGLTVIKTN